MYWYVLVLLCVHLTILLIECYPKPYGQAILQFSLFGWRCIIVTAVLKVRIVLVPKRKTERLLVIMFIPEFICYIVQSIHESIGNTIILKFQRFFLPYVSCWKTSSCYSS